MERVEVYVVLKLNIVAPTLFARSNLTNCLQDVLETTELLVYWNDYFWQRLGLTLSGPCSTLVFYSG